MHLKVIIFCLVLFCLTFNVFSFTPAETTREISFSNSTIISELRILNKNIIENASVQKEPEKIITTQNIFTYSNVNIFQNPNGTNEIEKMILIKTNQLRENKGFRLLDWDDQLADLARTHSLDMGKRNFFSHINPNGLDATKRAQKANIQTSTTIGNYTKIGIGENIFKVPISSNVSGCGEVTTSNQIATCAFNGWVQSNSHYNNLININYTELGIGVAIVDNVVYLTQNFR